MYLSNKLLIEKPKFYFLILFFVQKVFDFWSESFNRSFKTAFHLSKNWFEGNDCCGASFIYKHFPFFGERFQACLSELHSMCPSIWKNLSQLQLTCPTKRFEEKHVLRNNSNFRKCLVSGAKFLASLSKLHSTFAEERSEGSIYAKII